MKKAGLFLLAVVMVVGVAGCSNDDFSPNVSNMAGVYQLTKVTGTQGGATTNILYPDIWGKMILTTAGTYTVDISILGERARDSGTYAILEDTIIVDGGEMAGPITKNGHIFALSASEDGFTMTFEFTRS